MDDDAFLSDLDAESRPRRPRLLSDLQFPDHDRSPALSQQSCALRGEPESLIWALEVIQQNGDPLGAITIRESGLAIFTVNELFYE